MISYSRTGSELTVNSTYARTQAHAETARLADGRFVVTWVDADFNSSADRYIRAQVYEADGTPAGGELTVAGPINWAIQPTVTGLAGGGFVIAWDGSSATKAQVFDSASAPIGGMLTLAPHSGLGHPQIEALADGGFALAWDDDRTTGGDISGAGVRLQTFDAAGAATSEEVLVNTATARDQDHASVAVLTGGNRVVTWYDAGPGGGAPGAFKAQIFDSAGARVGGEFAINVTPGVAQMPAPVIALANGNFAIAWYQHSSPDGSAQHVQLFSATGERLGTEIVVPVQLGGIQVEPALAELSDGSLAIAWLANYGTTNDGSGRGVFVQVFDIGGAAFGAPMQVNTQANGDQIDPSIVALADGGFVVTWTDLNGAGADDDQIMAQVFGRSGTLDPVAISSNSGGDIAVIAVPENGLSVAQVEASGGFGALAYAIAGGADAALFAIDSATGALRFLAAPDAEAPADADGDNLYEVVVSAGDGVRSDSQALTIAVADLAEAPVIVSNGGGASAALALAEGSLAVTTVAAEDGDGDALIYAIAGGADAALFEIDAETGALRFLAAPEFAAPVDQGADNVYDVVISASDGALSTSQALSITVQQAPLGFATTQLEQWENYPDVLALGLTGANEGEPIVFSVTGGADAALFQLSEEGLIWLSPQDYEAPADADGDNAYEIEVTAEQGARTVTATLSFAMRNVNEAPSLVGDTEWHVSENGDFVGTLLGDDPEGDELRFFIDGGADGHLFMVDRESGEFGFLDAPDFELPSDADGDNVYEFVVGTHDGDLADTRTIFVVVDDVSETLSFEQTEFTGWETDVFVGFVSATGSGPDAPTYTISGGADAALFILNPENGYLRFATAPDYEAPADADGDGVYEVKVSAQAGESVGTATLVVGVIGINEAPVLTGPDSFTVAENGTQVATLAADDPEQGWLYFSIVGGVDAGRFAINSSTGALAFRTAPNFEAPTDSNQDNVYQVIVRVSDGYLNSSRAFAITVDNVEEPTTITSGGGGLAAGYSISENTTTVATIVATDSDGGVTYALAGGADAALFTIDPGTGVLRFASAPDFESPADADHNNQYQVIVSAGAGSSLDTQLVSVQVNNVTGVSRNGSSASETLTGTSEADTLQGNAGNDTLVGLGGADILVGGSQADRFEYRTVGDSTPTASDRIIDFTRGSPSLADKIDLVDVDANALLTGNQAFSFIGSAAFSSAAGQLRYFQQGSDTFIQGDVNGDGLADLQIVLDTQMSLVPSDFLL